MDDFSRSSKKSTPSATFVGRRVLDGLSHLSGFPIIRLRLSVSSGVAPVSGVPLRRRSNLGAGTRPEPSVDVGRLEIGPVASCEVALPTGRPDVADVASGNPLLDELVFLGRLQGDGVHAVSAADVPGIEPVDLQVPGRLMLPAEEVGVGDASGVAVRRMSHSWKEVLAGIRR